MCRSTPVDVKSATQGGEESERKGILISALLLRVENCDGYV